MLSYFLRLTAATHALGMVTEEGYLKFADHFLDQGVYTPLAELIMTPRPDWREASSLFDRTLRQLGVTVFTKQAATDLLVSHYLWGIAEEVWSPIDGVARFTKEFYEPLFGEYGSCLGKPTSFDKLVRIYYNLDEIQMWVEEQYLTAEERERGLKDGQKDCQNAINEYVADWMSQHCLVPLDPMWLTWNNGTVVRIAQTICDELAFDQLPILADSLEEAGCTAAAVLDHCRNSGPHICRCWVVDLLLGKE